MNLPKKIVVALGAVVLVGTIVIKLLLPPLYVSASRQFYAKNYDQAARLFFKQLRKPGALEEYSRFYLAESYFELGGYDLALEEYEKIEQKFPKGRFAKEVFTKRYFCYRGLYKLNKLNPEELLAIAKQFYQDNKIVDALEAASTTALRTDVTRGQYREAVYYRGLCRLFLRDFTNAERDLLRTVHWPGYGISSLYYLATLHRTKDNFYRAINYYRQVYSSAPGGSLADDAMYWTGFCYENLRNYAAAHQYYLRTAARYPRSNFADDCWWRIGIYYYRLGNYRTANYYFRNGFARQPGKDLSPELAYFAAKSARKINNMEQRETYLKEASKYYFSSFYGKRAAEVLGVTEDIKPLIPSKNNFVLENKNFKFFVKHKLYRDAERELQYVTKGLLEEQRVSTDQVIAMLAYEGEKYNDSIRLSAPLLLKTWRENKPAPVTWWALSFPRAYWEKVNRYGHKYKIDPYFALAVMREESLMNPEIVSAAQAIGLMQIIPETGQNLFTVLKRADFDKKKLFDPETNIELGLLYLSRLMKENKGNPYYVLAAYNAGQQAISKWIDRRPATYYIDEFIERVPYGETRMYVKRVMNTYLTYKIIYESNINPKYFRLEL
jgi:soluble lytic murein transglycosylase-like protein/TolA-binding protein